MTEKGSASVRLQVVEFKLTITSRIIHAASRGRSNLVHSALEKSLQRLDNSPCGALGHG